MSLASDLADWTDWDVASFALGCSLGVFAKGQWVAKKAAVGAGGGAARQPADRRFDWHSDHPAQVSGRLYNLGVVVAAHL